MRPQTCELGQLLGLELVALGGQVDLEGLLHLRGRGRENDDPVAQVDRLVDVVGHEHDRHPVLAPHLEDQVLQVARGSGRRPRRTARPSAGSPADRRAPARSPRAAACRPRAPTGSGPEKPVRSTDSTARSTSCEASSPSSRLRRSGKATFWRTLIQGKSERPYSWKTRAICSGGPSTGSSCEPHLAARSAPAVPTCTSAAWSCRSRTGRRCRRTRFSLHLELEIADRLDGIVSLSVGLAR